MYCIHCGAQNSDNNRFCLKCGQPLNQPAPQQPAQDWLPQQDWQSVSEQSWVPPTQDWSSAQPWPQAETVPEVDAVPEAEAVSETEAVSEVEAIPEEKAIPEVEAIPEEKAIPEVEAASELGAIPEIGAEFALDGQHENELDEFGDAQQEGTPVTGEASWPQGEGVDQDSGARWLPFSDGDPAQPVPPSDWATGEAEGVVGTATQDTIVRNGTWSSSDLVPPPPAPVPDAGGQGRPGLVIALCLATALAGGGALAYLLLKDTLVAAPSPAFSILIPVALGVAALLFAIAAIVVFRTGREPVQRVIEDLPPQSATPYQPEGPVSAGIPIALTDTNRPDAPFQLLLEGPVVIGRVEGECDLALPYEKSVSKRHCRIYPAQGTVYLEDLGGRNGTYLNGTQVVVPTSLHSGDMIKLGRLVLRVDIG